MGSGWSTGLRYPRAESLRGRRLARVDLRWECGILSFGSLVLDLGGIRTAAPDASVVLQEGDDDLHAGEHDPGHGEGVGQRQVEDLVGLHGQLAGEDVDAVLAALVGGFHFDEEEVRDTEDQRHRPAAGQQAPHQDQVVHLDRSAASFQGAHQLLVPEDADEEGGEDAAGLREVGAEAEHAAVGLPQEPAACEVRHGVRQVHQAVGDEVGHGQVDEEELVGVEAGPFGWEGAQGQPVVSQHSCQKHQCSDDGLHQLLRVHPLRIDEEEASVTFNRGEEEAQPLTGFGFPSRCLCVSPKEEW